MQKNQKKFYDDLMCKKSNFTFFTKDTRFNVNKLLNKKNINKYFDDFINKFIQNNDKILDYGCGPGTFSIKLSKMTQNDVYGIDISKGFIDHCISIKKKLNIKNFYPQLVENKKLPFEDNTFDSILMFDVIHHLEDIDQNFNEIKRVLKNDGKLIVYEPNKLNPLIWILHILDPIERGLLKVGTKKKYFDILKKHNLIPTHFTFSGIIVGPSSKILDIISKILNIKIIYKYFGWLNPKLVFIAKKL
jgi:ubiquinone/menaquinone biosynthesis C-methylase UbiE